MRPAYDMMPLVGRWNFLVEGVSGTGKTSVCHELRRRGYDALNGDVDLAVSFFPGRARSTAADVHANHGWDVERVRERAADTSERLTFFCGGARNFAELLEVFDGVVVLEIDRATLVDRLARREPGDWGTTDEQRDLVLHLHAAGDAVPPGTPVDATRPLADVVEEILAIAERTAAGGSSAHDA